MTGSGTTSMAPSEKQQYSPKKIEAAITDIKLSTGNFNDMGIKVNSRDIKDEATPSDTMSSSGLGIKSSSTSPKVSADSSHSSHVSTPKEETGGGNITIRQQAGQTPKIVRNLSQRPLMRPSVLFHDFPNKTEEAKGTFQVLTACIYQSKAIGATEAAMDCECAEEWDSATCMNDACGEDSDCINRATKMECIADCGCGPGCQNRRLQQEEYADVTVIKTEKKGYGLRTNTDLKAHDLIYEYIGEVINEPTMRRRFVQYADEGEKHFYFMSLNKEEFVDATRKGNLGRFCNHSCNPNCYVDKWVVGSKLRMGIFAERKIQAGEELVFNYNVDRYGTDPQPCYCGEPNCVGFIGGKTQTERATKLPQLTIEALGIDDGDGWDTAVAKKSRKKKANEDDEEYVNNVEPKALDEDGVTKVMATLMQCKEKWITVKLLSRIQRCYDERVRSRVIKMHGYQILNSVLSLWKEDVNVVLQVLDILNQFPRLTRNKISDSKIEDTVESLKESGEERVEAQASALLREWSTLEVAYRIPRMKRDPSVVTTLNKPDRFGRRESEREDRKRRSRSHSASRSRSRSRSRSIDAPRGPAASNGPRTGAPQRNANFFQGSKPPFRPRAFNSLPPGWFTAVSEGRTYYYSATGQTTWTMPTTPALQPPPPPKPVSSTKVLEDIINDITSAQANTARTKPSAATTPQTSDGKPKKEETGKEKWRSYSEEKQKKIYENTLFPHIKHVVDKYKNKLPKDDLKRFAKEISKKLMNSDYKNNRVEDPTKITTSQERQVKKYTRDFFDKAVAKKKQYEGKKADKEQKGEVVVTTSVVDTKENMAEEHKRQQKQDSDGEQGMDMSDDELDKPKPCAATPLASATPFTPVDQSVDTDGLKRKRSEGDERNGNNDVDVNSTPSKRQRSETPTPPPPPPPPPPPAATIEGRHSKPVTPEDLPTTPWEDVELKPLEESRTSGNDNVHDDSFPLTSRPHIPFDADQMDIETKEMPESIQALGMLAVQSRSTSECQDIPDRQEQSLSSVDDRHTAESQALSGH